LNGPSRTPGWSDGRDTISCRWATAEQSNFPRFYQELEAHGAQLSDSILIDGPTVMLSAKAVQEGLRHLPTIRKPLNPKSFRAALTRTFKKEAGAG